jgi:hypothetical protein
MRVPGASFQGKRLIRSKERAKAGRSFSELRPRYASVFSDFCRGVSYALDPLDKSGFLSYSRTGDQSKLRPFRPDEFTDPDEARVSYLLSELIRKYPDFPGDKDERKRNALSSFRKAEEQCSRTNERLSNLLCTIVFDNVDAGTVIEHASAKISRLLGPFDVDEAARKFGFGPGASTRVPRRKSDAWYKFSGKPETTYNNIIFAEAILCYWDLWGNPIYGPMQAECPRTSFTVVDCNRVVTVPKNAKTERSIAIEPDLNLFVQKGIGAMIRKRLKRVSVDLDDQTLNQDLARVASLPGFDIATVDLSMASDTVSKRLVELLMPPDWLAAMDQCRSPSGVLEDGTKVLYRKYSSMGNGYTFELESLIFWALVSSVYSLRKVKGGVLSVYGDDLIVLSDQLPAILNTLDFCGFTINCEKSFASGPFRESCGKHFFSGQDISPFYVRNDVISVADVLLLANNIVRWSARGCYRDASLKPVYDELVRMLPSRFQKVSIPDGYGDGALIGDFDEISPRKCPKQLEGYLCQTYLPVREMRRGTGTPQLVKSLFGSKDPWGGKSYCFVRLDGSVIRASFDHPVLSLEKGWRRAVGTMIPHGPEAHKKGNILVRRFRYLGPWF